MSQSLRRAFQRNARFFFRELVWSVFRRPRTLCFSAELSGIVTKIQLTGCPKQQDHHMCRVHPCLGVHRGEPPLEANSGHGHPLGRGSAGIVYRGTYVYWNYRTQDVAVKILRSKKDRHNFRLPSLSNHQRYFRGQRTCVALH